jgi:hypothetical protein
LLDHDFVSTWQQYANGWRIDTDVECYYNTLVTWNNSVKQRFTDVVPWISDARPGGWNNLDSLDVGAGSIDGLSNDERQTYTTLTDTLEDHPFETRLADLFANLTKTNGSYWNHISEGIDRHAPDTDNACCTKQ